MSRWTRTPLSSARRSSIPSVSLLGEPFPTPEEHRRYPSWKILLGRAVPNPRRAPAPHPVRSSWVPARLPQLGDRTQNVMDSDPLRFQRASPNLETEPPEHEGETRPGVTTASRRHVCVQRERIPHAVGERTPQSERVRLQVKNRQPPKKE